LRWSRTVTRKPPVLRDIQHRVPLRQRMPATVSFDGFGYPTCFGWAVIFRVGTNSPPDWGFRSPIAAAR
jgi:hypothetical protein